MHVKPSPLSCREKLALTGGIKLQIYMPRLQEAEQQPWEGGNHCWVFS